MMGLDDKILDHRKFVRAAKLGGGDAIFMWLGMRQYCEQQESDGHIPEDMIDECRGPLTPKKRKAALQVLIDVGLVDLCPSGYQLHDYSDWALTRDQKEAKREKWRIRQGRSRRVSRSDTSSDTDSDAPETQHKVTDSSPVQSSPVQSKPPSGGSRARTRVSAFDEQPLVPVTDWPGPDELFGHHKRAREHDLDVAVEATKFRDWHAAAGTLLAAEQWPHKFMTWLNRAPGMAPKGRNGASPESPAERDKRELRDIETNARSGKYGEKFADQALEGKFDARAFRQRAQARGISL